MKTVPKLHCESHISAFSLNDVESDVITQFPGHGHKQILTASLFCSPPHVNATYINIISQHYFPEDYRH